MYSNGKIKLEKCEGGGDKVGEKRVGERQRLDDGGGRDEEEV